MGILEVHFHDSEFDFSPSMQTGGDELTDEQAEAATTDTADGTAAEPDEASDGRGLGIVVALAVLVVVAALVGLGWRWSGDDSGAADEPDEAVGVST